MKLCFFALVLAGALSFAGCGDDGDNNGDNNGSPNANNTSSNANNSSPNGTTNNVDENIFPGVDFGVTNVTAVDGGTVELASGRGSIEIPAGALPEDAEIRIRLNTTVNNHDGLWNSGGGPTPFTINLEPKGTVLSQPATLRFDLTNEEMALANTDGQVWQFALASDAGGEDAIVSADVTAESDSIEITTEVTELADYSPVGIGKVLLDPSCTDCPTGMDHTLTVDVENVLAPTIGFDLAVTPGEFLTFTETSSTGGAAAPMTHERVDFTFQCSAAGETSVEVDFLANLGPESPTFGWSAPLTADITCQ